ncbi:membrane protein insertase YidC [Candidatus Gottesmanbacteria bacterium]|nr:membrane protein insertase YidC [Candidatus Gottesmanbacteria bacterium]
MFETQSIFDTLLLIPILNLLIGIYKALLFLHLPGAFGFSLILLTIVIRILLNPLMATQLKNTHKLAKLKPELDRLSREHKDDKKRLSQEQLRLYQEAGVNPAAGCLPLLLQMPILLGLYNLFFKLLNGADISSVVDGINRVVYAPFLTIQSLDLSFFGVNLAQKPSDWQTAGIFLLTIPLLTALLQYWQTKTMTPTVSPPMEGKSLEKTGEKKEEDMSTTMQKQMSIMMPLMIGFFAYTFPIGLSLYWNTFTVFGIIQQRQIANKLK